jgi:hypothetical protein
MTDKKGRWRPQSAEDFLAQLAADPEYQARKTAWNAETKKVAEALARAEAPVVVALQEAGFEITSVWDFVNTTQPYVGALPILLDHLQRDYPDKVRESIARAMAVPDSKFAWRTLLKLFQQDFDPKANGVKWAVGAGLAAAADDEVIGDLIALFRNPRHGENRVVFVEALSKSRNAEARLALEQAREDPAVSREIRRVLDRPRRKRHR